MMTGEVLKRVRIATSALSRSAVDKGLSCLSWVVFAILDLTDQILCPVFALLDFFLDSEKRVCYCRSDEIQHGDRHANIVDKEFLSGGAFAGGLYSLESWSRSSDSLHAHVRRYGRTRFHLLTLHRTLSGEDSKPKQSITPYKDNITEKFPNGVVETIFPPVVDVGEISKRAIVPTTNSHFRRLSERPANTVISGQGTLQQRARWSDCGCRRCTSWQLDENQLLYVHIDDKDFVASVGKDLNAANLAAENNVIFIHGFLSSSSFWADTVLPALPESVRSSHRLFAVDILGFGRSPKPSNSLYTIADHIGMIRKSVLEPHEIKSFHLVAHSMGCTVSLALAAHYSSSLKSITLIAPPYFPTLPGNSSSTYIMQQVAARRIWPLMTFGSSVMSWYEHIGRAVCIVVCKYHRLWEPFLFFLHSMLPGNWAPLSCITDFTRHTHHSAWHSFHNTICTGGYVADLCLEVLRRAGRRVRVIHGTKDAVIPFKTSVILSERHTNVRLTCVTSADHTTVVFGREAELAEELAEQILFKPLERQEGQDASICISHFIS